MTCNNTLKYKQMAKDDSKGLLSLSSNNKSPQL